MTDASAMMNDDTLRQHFTNYLLERARQIEALGTELHQQWSLPGIYQLLVELHTLGEAADKYRFTSVSMAAAQLADYLQDLARHDTQQPSKEQRDKFNGMLYSLIQFANDPQALTLADLPRALAEAYLDDEPRQRQIFWLGLPYTDTALLEHMLNAADYTVEWFPDLGTLEQRLASQLPVALVVASEFSSFDAPMLAGLRVLTETRLGKVPVIMLSSQPDLPARLTAVQAGAAAYLTHPVNANELIETLSSLGQDHQLEPLRILIAEDTPSLASYFSSLLSQAGMNTLMLTDPSRLLDAGIAFKPDLILLDMQPPGTPSLDLARALRQHRNFATTPIVFLSNEKTPAYQYRVLDAGVDRFLTKPVMPDYLVASVQTLAGRARTTGTQMRHDNLTGLLNDVALQDQLEREVARARRHVYPLSYAIIDIDSFQHINETYGHATGDRVIQNLSRFLRERLRRTDIIGRLNRDQLGVILINAEGSAAHKVLDSLRESFANQPQRHGRHKIDVTFCVGLASMPNETSSSGILASAGHALQLAKDSGRNQTVWNN
jgi:two-component system cell cycle response regulator